MKWYIRLTVALSAALLLSGGGYLFWSFLPSKRPVHSRVQQSHLPDALLPSSAQSATDTSLALFMHQMTPGTVLTTALEKNGSIPVASTIAKTGEASVLGKALSDGLFLYLNKMNTQEQKSAVLTLHQRDDQGQVLKAVRELGELLDEHDLFLSSMGDSALEKVYVPLLKAQKASLFFPVAGARPHLEKPLPLIFFRPSYAQEVAALVYYATHILKQQKVAVFYEESDWGVAGKQAVEQVLAGQQLSLAAAASYQPGTVNIQSALATMQQAQPHVVICIASARPAYNFIREAINKQLHYVSFLGISRLTNIADHLRTSRGITLVTSSVVPNPHNSQLPIAEAYRADMQRYLPNKGLSTYSLEGYINSMLFAYFLEQLPEGATVQDLWHAMLQTQNVTFKGLHLEQHKNTLSHTVWINEGREKPWHEYVVRDI